VLDFAQLGALSQNGASETEPQWNQAFRLSGAVFPTMLSTTTGKDSKAFLNHELTVVS
jgi:hypothetical protein